MKAWMLALAFSLAGCASLKKDNQPKDAAPPVSDEVEAQLKVYRPAIKAAADSHGLAVMGGSIGDSAIFSCLGRVGGGLSFDPAILFKDGKPIRHPDIAPSATPNAKGGRGTPVSRDMVDGILWCMWDLHHHGETAHAAELVQAMIDFGKAHTFKVGTDLGWLFCTEEDRQAYAISDEDWLGKCWMTPGVVKDIYRVAKLVGIECDSTCQLYMTLGPNVPADSTGFQRHLAVTGTVRNGLVEGALNDNSLNIVLQKAANEQPRNALYLASYHLFGDGDQQAAYKVLGDHDLFPADHLPTSANYCTDYLFQRDDDSASTDPKPDWKPCGDGSEGPQGRGIEWIFAATMALGELTKVPVDDAAP